MHAHKGAEGAEVWARIVLRRGGGGVYIYMWHTHCKGARVILALPDRTAARLHRENNQIYSSEGSRGWNSIDVCDGIGLRGSFEFESRVC